MASIYTTTYTLSLFVSNFQGSAPGDIGDYFAGDIVTPLFWASNTEEDALAKFNSLIAGGGCDLDISTDVPSPGSCYISTPEVVDISSDTNVPSYVLSVKRFAFGLNNPPTDGPAADNPYYFLIEYDVDYLRTPTEGDYNACNPRGTYSGWPGLDYLFIPIISYSTTMDSVWGDYIPTTTGPTGDATNSQYFEGVSGPVVTTDSMFELAWNDDGRWYPPTSPTDPDTPLKYYPNVSVINVDFAEGARHAVIHPSKDGGFVIYETDSTYLIPFGLAKVFRHDRTLSAVIPVDLLKTYLPRV